MVGYQYHQTKGFWRLARNNYREILSETVRFLGLVGGTYCLEGVKRLFVGGSGCLIQGYLKVR